MPEPHYDLFSPWTNGVTNQPKTPSKSAQQQSSRSTPIRGPQMSMSLLSESSSDPKVLPVPTGVDLPLGVKIIGTCPDGGALIQFMHARGLW